MQRTPYYIGVPLAGATAWFGLYSPGATARIGFWLLAALFAYSTAFGLYHSGVEWGFWPGPAACTGTIKSAPKVDDFLKELQTIQIVRCDAVAIRILGLSLAGWNAVVSALIAVLAARAAHQPAPSQA